MIKRWPESPLLFLFLFYKYLFFIHLIWIPPLYGVKFFKTQFHYSGTGST